MVTDRMNTDIRSLMHAPSRRDLWRGLAGAGLGLGTARWQLTAEAKKKRKHKKRKKKAKPNAFGCVNVGNFCKNSGQCCSGICAGKKGKTCQAHDASTCQAGQTVVACGGVDTFCTTSGGETGACTTTSGNAGYCTKTANCFACSRDADCEAVCGPQAACLPCALSCTATGGTACAGPATGSCTFQS